MSTITVFGWEDVPSKGTSPPDVTLLRQELIHRSKPARWLWQPADDERSFRLIENHNRFAIEYGDLDDEESVQGWTFSRARFAALARMIQDWWSASFGLAHLWSVRSGLNHSRKLYFPPGGPPRATPGDATPPQMNLERRPGGPECGKGLKPVYTWVNEEGALVCRHFRWGALDVLWLGGRLVLLRGRSLTEAETQVVLRTNVTIDYNVKRPPSWLILSASDAAFLVSVARVVAARR